MRSSYFGSITKTSPLNFVEETGEQLGPFVPITSLHQLVEKEDHQTLPRRAHISMEEVSGSVYSQFFT